MKLRQQNTTSYPIPIFMVRNDDHITGLTGLTLTVILSKNGALSFGPASGAVTEAGNGWYWLAGNAPDRDTLGDLLVHASATNADPYDANYTIIPFNPFDAVSLGLSIFSGITSLAKWIRGLARKDAMDAVAKVELNTGGGAYDETTDSQEAIKDSLSGVGLTAAQVWAYATRTLTKFGVGSVEFTYTVTDTSTGLPVENVEVWTTTDLAGTNIVWKGYTDAFGVARDPNLELPYFDPGTYYFWKRKTGFTDAQNPDLEVVV
jgi:hypothetical protein